MTQAEILAKLASQEITPQEASSLLDALQSPKNSKELRCKVSEKKACSVYGLQRMPVTLYVEQWERLFEFADTVKAFLAENAAVLSRKDRV